jgi:hypothetical protein
MQQLFIPHRVRDELQHQVEIHLLLLRGVAAQGERERKHKTLRMRNRNQDITFQAAQGLVSEPGDLQALCVPMDSVNYLCRRRRGSIRRPRAPVHPPPRTVVL